VRKGRGAATCEELEAWEDREWRVDLVSRGWIVAWGCFVRRQETTDVAPLAQRKERADDDESPSVAGTSFASSQPMRRTS
jgi:hypothetical protein